MMSFQPKFSLHKSWIINFASNILPFQYTWRIKNRQNLTKNSSFGVFFSIDLNTKDSKFRFKRKVQYLRTYRKLFQLVLKTNLSWLTREKNRKKIRTFIYYQRTKLEANFVSLQSQLARADIKKVARVLRYSMLERDFNRSSIWKLRSTKTWVCFLCNLT